MVFNPFPHPDGGGKPDHVDVSWFMILLSLVPVGVIPVVGGSAVFILNNTDNPSNVANQAWNDIVLSIAVQVWWVGLLIPIASEALFSALFPGRAVLGGYLGLVMYVALFGSVAYTLYRIYKQDGGQ